MPNTPEQEEFIRAECPRLRGMAFAGTGKTFTLVQYAKARPDRTFLYVAYNRPIRDEAERKFPPNAVCKTSHQLAWPGFGARYAHKLVSDLRLGEIVHVLRRVGYKADYASVSRAIAAVKNYHSTADETLSARHVPPARNRFQDDDEALDMARELWKRMCDMDDGTVGMLHDGYLKLWQLSAPVLNFHYILFDEGQDANEVLSYVLLNQNAKLVVVGDRHQQIYRFRGAVDALQRLQADATCYLTHSFRFGPAIAEFANAVLQTYKGETVSVVGCGPDTRVGEVDRGEPHAILLRTFAGVFDAAAGAVSQDLALGWIGGINNYPLHRISDLYWLYAGQPGRVREKRLVSMYPTYIDYAEAASESGDSEMKRLVRVVEGYQNSIPELLDLMRQKTVPERSDQAHVLVSTAHRAKGLEFPQVILGADFPELDDPKLDPPERDDEANLLYVSLTRATHALEPNMEVIKTAERWKTIKETPARPATA